MNAGKAVYGILSGTTAVTDIVGTRIFPEIAEQEAVTPFVIYQLQSVAPEDTHDGPSKLDEVRFEFLCYADSYNEAADLGVAVRGALDRVSGTYNGVNVESVQFNDVDVEIEYDPRRYSQVLKFTFRIKRDDIEIALGTPVTGAQLGDLSDVNVDGVTDNQILSYDAATDTWVPAADAGGAETLDDLTDVDAGAPSSGQLLAYGQDTWETIAQDELTLPIGSVTGLQAALDAAPDNLRELTDVTISGLADNDYLQYDSASGKWQNSSLILGRNGEQYTGNYDSEAETLLDGATETVELYYTAQADGDGLHEDAQTDTATTGYDIRRKLYYAEKAQADPDTSGDWTQFADIADDTTYASAKATLLAYLKARTGGTVPISLKMTWEEVAEAPSFTGLLNESYGSGASAAYSVRRLNGNYTGSAIQVERSSDNTTQDIGFDSNGDLDESALTTFCTGTTCKVRTWYDQATAGGTGSGNDAVQTTHANQPTIYTGGAIVKENGRVAVQGTSSSTELVAAISHTVTAQSTFGTGTYVYGSNDRFISQNNGGADYTASDAYIIGYANATNTISSFLNAAARSSITVSNNQHMLFSSVHSGSSLLNAVNGTTGTAYTHTLNSTFSRLGIMGTGGSVAEGWQGKMQEVVMYDADKSTDRTSIESNIGDYFTQNTPLLDTYTGAAAAYSLRKLRTAYTGSAIRVRRASDNAEQDINFNVFGELDTVSLASFCSGTDGFVKTWYDQASTNDATQTNTANQPKIYDSSTGVNTLNGKPATVQASNAFITSPTMSFNSAVSLSFVCSLTSNSFILSGQTTNQEMLIAQSGSTSTQIDSQVGTPAYYLNGTSKAFTDRGDVYTSFNTQKLLYADADFSAWTEINFGYAFSPSGFPMANMQEFVIWNSDQSSNRTNIEDNINTFYSIY